MEVIPPMVPTIPVVCSSLCVAFSVSRFDTFVWIHVINQHHLVRNIRICDRVVDSSLKGLTDLSAAGSGVIKWMSICVKCWKLCLLRLFPQRLRGVIDCAIWQYEFYPLGDSKVGTNLQQKIRDPISNPCSRNVTHAKLSMILRLVHSDRTWLASTSQVTRC